MIEKISKVNNIGKYNSFEQKSSFIKGCNIIFGYNWSGKTTISNILSLFGNDSFISKEQKELLFEDMKNDNKSSSVEIILNGNNLKYPSKNHKEHSVYVFNSNFVANHVFDGTKAKLSSFSKSSASITNEKIIQLERQIAEKNELKEKLKAENKSLLKEFNKIKTKYSEEFNKNISDKNMPSIKYEKLELPNEPITDLKLQKERLLEDYKLTKRQQEVHDDLEQLKNLPFIPCKIDLKKINDLLGKEIKQLAQKALEKKINCIRELFSEDFKKNNVNEWFHFGKDILEHLTERKCPLCDSDISEKMDIILQDFHEYFGQEYENLINELKEQKTYLDNFIDNDANANKNNFKHLKNLYEKYQLVLPVDFPVIDINFYDFIGILREIRDSLSHKIKNVQFCKNYSEYEKISDINSKLNLLDELRKSIIHELETKDLSEKEAEKIIEKIKDTYKKIIALECNDGENRQLEKYKKNYKNIPEIENDIKSLEDERRQELIKLKVESKSISKFLKQIGIDHFAVDINEQATDENIIITYTNSQTSKNKLRNSLSEGEKTALALAYFLSKFENEVNNADLRSKSIVIIDDPVSSLDQNCLYNIANIIKKEFELNSIEQLIVFSHNLSFLKFFNRLYSSKKKQCFLLRENELVYLPKELNNFESPYFFMLGDICDYIDNLLDYNTVKIYLPNYMRRVLETFLAFKFGRIEQNGRSLGINDFWKSDIKNLGEIVNINENELNEIEQKLTKIKRVTDLHSHGNIQLTDESCYISENDLRTCANDVLWIMDKLDSLHIAKVKENFKNTSTE